MQIEIMKLRKMVTLIFFSKKSKSLSILPSYVSDRFVIIQIFPMGYCLNFRPFHNCVKHINRFLLANHTKRKTTTIRWNNFAPSLTSPEAYLMYTNLKDKDLLCTECPLLDLIITDRILLFVGRAAYYVSKSKTLWWM